MRTVFLGVLALGIALAGFAVYMAQNFIGQTQAQLEKEQAMRQRIGALVEVYVVNKPVNYGDTITPDDVQLIYWQKNALPEGAFTPEAPLFAEGVDTLVLECTNLPPHARAIQAATGWALFGLVDEPALTGWAPTRRPRAGGDPGGGGGPRRPGFPPAQE